MYIASSIIIMIVIYVVLAFFNMDSERIIKVNYFDLCDFYDRSKNNSFATKIDFNKVKSYSRLIPWRFERSKTYVEDIDKLRCILSGILIFKSFGPAEEKVSYNKFNKPYFDSSEWNFSISHAGDYVVFVRDTGKIGIDIEKISMENLDIIDYPFDDIEKALIINDPTKLTRFWTIKESVFKASGTEKPIEYRDINVASSLNNGIVSLFGVEYNILGEYISDYCLSIASAKKYDKIVLLKENL